MAKVIRSATARQVREFFAENKALVPAEAAQSLKPGSRGRIHPAARAEFNKHKRMTGLVYEEGNVKTMVLPYPATDAKGRSITKKAHVPVKKVRELAGAFAGQRGTLSENALVFAGEQYAQSLK